jgi:hypothetical protein
MRNDRQFMLRPRSGLTQDDAGERRAELPSGVAAPPTLPGRGYAVHDWD